MSEQQSTPDVPEPQKQGPEAEASTTASVATREGGIAARGWRLIRGDGRSGVRAWLARPVRAAVRGRQLSAPLGVVLAAACLVLIVVVGSVMYATPLFGARTVTVRGASIVDDRRVREAAAIDDGAPLASLDTKAIAERVEDVPQVAAAVVVRDWPSTVRIEVAERKPAAAFARPGGGYEIVDTLGVPFLTQTARPASLPLVEVPKIPVQGKRTKLTVSAVGAVRALTPQLRAQLVKVTADAPERVTLVLSGNRTVFWGEGYDDGDNSRKATAATALLAKPGRYIDVSAPGVVTVR